MKRFILFVAAISLMALSLLTSCKKDNDDKKLPVLTTNEATDITHNSAISGGIINDDGGSTITKRGVCWSKKINPTIKDNKSIDGAGAGQFTSLITGLDFNEVYYIRAYASNEFSTGYGMVYSFKTKGAVVDSDGNIYRTIVIGDQEWMKENLKTTKYSDGSQIEYPGTDNNAWMTNTSGAYAWYNNDSSWKNYYGALYNWFAVNNPAGLCPIGWHIPSDSDWYKLAEFIGGKSNGNKLKSCRQINSPLEGECKTTQHPRWLSHPIHYGTDDYGFAALPGGDRIGNGLVGYFEEFGFWWSSSEYSNSQAWFRSLDFNHSHIGVFKWEKQWGLSIRCLKDYR
jgi:uncharacterized protein (TIGR02145 family)